MKYRRFLAFTLPLFLLIPGVSRAARAALTGVSNRFPFPCAIIAAGYLFFRFRARRLIAAVEIIALLYFPLLSNAPYPISAQYGKEAVVRLCLALSGDAERYAASEPLSFSDVADECRALSGGVVKFARFPEWMTLTRTAGIYIPLTGEAILNPREPAFSLPFLALHEIAHQSGLMNEGQASVRAYLWAMSSGNSAFRYSASVEALRRAVSVLFEIAPEDALAVVRVFPPRVKSDVCALGALSPKASGHAAILRLAGDYRDLAGYLLPLVQADALPGD